MTVDFDKLHGLTGTMSKKKERELKRKISYMQLDVELSKRVSHAQGLVYDQFDGLNEHSRAKIDMTKTFSKNAIPVGATSVEVDSAEGFKIGQEVTVYDHVNIERPIISDIRSEGETHEVIDATVVNEAYDTSGNGGRKLVMLENGWLVAAVKKQAYYYLYVNKQDGNGFTSLGYMYFGQTFTGDISIVNKSNMLYVLYCNAATVQFIKIDVPNATPKNYQDGTQTVIATESSMGNLSFAINEAGTELHAAWASKNNSYPNSFNIRYAKGTINGDGSVTWGSVEQCTTLNTSGANALQPSVLSNGKILFLCDYPASPVSIIGILDKNSPTKSINTSFPYGNILIYDGGSNTQSSPSAIFVPPSVNGLPQGRIWVAWHGTDSTDTTATNIRVSYSDNGGETWSTVQKLTSGNTFHQTDASLTANHDGHVFVVFSGATTANAYRNVRMGSNLNGTWGAIQEFNTGITVQNNIPADRPNVSTLFDSNFSSDFTTPLFIYKNIQTPKVGFYGTWTEGQDYIDFTEPLTKSFQERSGIARTNAEIKDGELVFGKWQGKGYVIKEVD